MAPAANGAEARQPGQDRQEPHTLRWSDLRPGDDPVCRSLFRQYRDPKSCRRQGLEGFLFRGKFMQCGAATAELDGRRIRIAGYAHPLAFQFRNVTRFLLTPPATPCPHAFAPPPNQLILVDFPGGIDIGADPVFVSGTLTTRSVKTDLATAAYTLTAESVEPALIPDAATVED